MSFCKMGLEQGHNLPTCESWGASSQLTAQLLIENWFYSGHVNCCMWESMAGQRSGWVKVSGPKRPKLIFIFFLVFFIVYITNMTFKLS